MTKSPIAIGLVSALTLSSLVASAAECRTDRVDVETSAICGPFGQRLAPLSEGFSLFDGEGVSFVTGLGGNPVFTAPADLKFAEKLTKVGLIIYHGTHVD